MINKCNKNIASCVKIAFIYLLDEEYKLYSQWKENIFRDAHNYTFAFIFSLSDSLKGDQIN